MEEKYILGSRLRNFRKRAGLSQLQLETEIGMSPGGLSRIENGEVNPLKETLQDISIALSLNDSEKRYLFGDTFYKASEKEVTNALRSISEHFEKKGTLAYLIDDRFRFLGISETFRKFLGFTDEQVESARYKSIARVILSDDWNVKDVLDPEAYSDIVMNLLWSFYSEMNFMIDDEVYIETIESINKNLVAAQIWSNIKVDKPQVHNINESRQVVLKLMGIKFDLSFIREPLHNARRFEIIEYVPTSKLVKYLSTFL